MVESTNVIVDKVPSVPAAQLNANGVAPFDNVRVMVHNENLAADELRNDADGSVMPWENVVFVNNSVEAEKDVAASSVTGVVKVMFEMLTVDDVVGKSAENVSVPIEALESANAAPVSVTEENRRVLVTVPPVIENVCPAV